MGLSSKELAGLRDYLLSFDLFRGIEQEGINYLNDCWERLWITLGLVPSAPKDRPGKLLELGSNPYFMTLLLTRFRTYELSLSNYFGSTHPEKIGTQSIHSSKYLEERCFTYQHFNVEMDRFPYADGFFDVVLFCEILEHLTMDPSWTLSEIHRVLKPGGYLILTTPNVLRLQNLRHLLRGKNIYDSYSGYGVYGRHNREYTSNELFRLVRLSGYEIVKMICRDLQRHSFFHRLFVKSIFRERGEGIFLLARTTGGPRRRYPDWLYRSRAKLMNATDSEIVMGENEEGHLGSGWYDFEPLAVPIRWTGAQAQVFLMRRKCDIWLRVDVNAGPFRLGSVPLTLTVGSMEKEFELSPEIWNKLVLQLPEGEPGPISVVLAVDHTRNPARLGISRDDRELGVMVKRMALVATV